MDAFLGPEDLKDQLLIEAGAFGMDYAERNFQFLSDPLMDDDWIKRKTNFLNELFALPELAILDEHPDADDFITDLAAVAIANCITRLDELHESDFDG